MKITTLNTTMVFTPDSQYDQYLIGVISAKLDCTVHSSVGDDAAVQDMDIEKASLLNFLIEAYNHNRHK